MIAGLRRTLDSLRGGGESSVTVPPMDGALNPNNRLEEADLVVSAEAPDNLCLANSAILFSVGDAIRRIDRGGEVAVPFASFGSRVSALAAAEDGLAIGLSEGAVRLRGGPYDGRTLTAVGGRPLRCVTALSFVDPHTLLVCLGSAKHPPEEWKRDLMELGATGSVWRYDLAKDNATLIGDRLAYPFGVMALDNGAVLVCESWRHRLLRYAPGRTSPEAILSDLPAYPARVAPAANGGGAWLTLFAPRRQLTEFVLREPVYRRRMMAEVPPDYWVGPTLAPMKSFLEPLQGGTLKKLAAIKPWAPSRSYGLIVRLDENYQPTQSFHSRADGRRHGITSVVEVDGRVLATSHGAGAVVAVDLSDDGD